MIEQLKRLRDLWGWSQAFVAEMLRVSRSSISRWERGKGEPNPSNKEKLDALVTTLQKAKEDHKLGDPPAVEVITAGDRVAGDKIVKGDAAGRDVITTGDGTTYMISDSIVIVVADVEVLRQLLGDQVPSKS